MERSEETNPKEPKGSEAKKPEDRQSEATSKKTLSDLEHDQKLFHTTPDRPGDEESVPSPDGEVGESRGGRADGSDTGGPM